jgi:poly-gamma-glutamate capsule biosynthesis protein CapA/YwtB (metallophosphatase superfamily)
VRLALAGDTMLGRGVAERIREESPESLFAPAVVEAARDADLLVVNLECCISERGEPAPRRVFHFRAPPEAVAALTHLGVDCVTLANNHALDYGPEALLDTLEHLRAAGIAWVGAGVDEDGARQPRVLAAGEERLRIIAVSDHPAEYAAGPGRAGIAFADLPDEGVPAWLAHLIAEDSEPVIVCPHWGPNMTPSPVPHVRRAADAIREAGAVLVAGHSAHVFHGVAGPVLFDLGDFVDDYRLDPWLRNDLGLLWFVDLDARRPVRIEALPLALDFCHTRLAEGEERDWIARRFRAACAELGTEVAEESGRLVMDLSR